jgi:hypothetical protein
MTEFINTHPDIPVFPEFLHEGAQLHILQDELHKLQDEFGNILQAQGNKNKFSCTELSSLSNSEL